MLRLTKSGCVASGTGNEISTMIWNYQHALMNGQRNDNWDGRQAELIITKQNSPHRIHIYNMTTEVTMIFERV